MSILIRLTLSIAAIFFSSSVFSQCVFNNVQYPSGTFTPTTTWSNATTLNYAGEHIAFNVTTGNTYEFTTCPEFGGNATYDSQLTLFRSTNTTVALDYSDDDCNGDDAYISWVATFTGIVYVQLNEFDCTTNSTSSTVSFRVINSGGGTPANDNCANSTLVVATPVCTPIQSSLSGATGSNPVACTGTNTDDVWFSVVSSSTEDILIEVTPNGTGLDPVIEVFAGISCADLTSFGCVDETLDGEAEAVNITGAQPLEIIWVRVYDYYSAAALNPNFTFCATQAGGTTTNGDDCSNAIPLVTNDNCIPVSGNLGDFSISSSPATTCGGSLSSDAWYVITAEVDSLLFSVIPDGLVDPIIEIYSGTGCGDLALLGCADFNIAGEEEAIIISPTTPGEQFWLRVFDYSGNATSNLGYQICAYNIGAPIGGTPGDECATAIPLTTTLTCNPTTGNLGNFTTSTNPATSCGGSDVADAWYLLTATADSLYFTVNPLGNTDLVAEIYDGTNCGDLALIGCGDFTLSGESEDIILSPTTPGQQFWLRVYDYNGNASVNLGYEICAYNFFQGAPQPPANDECDGAVTIVAGTSCNPIAGTLENATESLPITSCGGSNDEDVWYEIVASDTAVTIEMTPDFSTLGIVAEIFVPISVGDCSNMISLGCVDNTLAGEPETVNIIGMQPGQSVFVRIYDFITATPTNPGFTICAYWDPQSSGPTNDECAGAVPISAGSSCNPVSGSTAGATGSLPVSSCSPGGIVEGDVWFSFVATATSANITVNPVDDFDAVIQYFSGSCANLVSRGCSDVFVEGNAEQLAATGLIIGQTYYVRVYDYRGLAATGTEFTICIQNNTTPSNDNCAGATPIALGDQYLVQDAALATQSLAGCSGNANDDVWFSFQAGENPDGTTIAVLGDLDFESVFQVYSGSCANLTSIACVNDVTTGTYDQEVLTLTTLTPGSTYYVRVYDFQASNTNSTFYLAIVGTPVGCNLAAPTVSSGGQNAICAGSSVMLTSSASGSVNYQWQLNGIDIPGATSSSYSASVAGTYGLIITDSQGCSAVSSTIPLTVGQNPSPVATAGGSTTICGSGSVSLSTTGAAGQAYQWFQNGTAITGAIQNTYSAFATGSYTVQVTNTAGCLGMSNAIQVNVVGSVSATISNSGNTTICQGSSTILSVNTQSGNAIQWYLGGNAINGATSVSYTASQAGTYSAQVSNGPSCTATSNTITISVVAGPNASISAGGATTFCSGGSVQLNLTPVSGATYQWLLNGSPILGASQQTYSATEAGSYAALVTTTACAATSNQVDIIVNQAPAASIFAEGPTTFCQGNSVQLTAPTGNGYSYQWFRNGAILTGSTNSTYTATTSGNYVVSITANGCTGNSSAVAVNVTNPPAANISVNGNATVCQGNTVQLSASVGSNLSYQWLLNGTPIPNATSVTYTATSSGNYSVIVSQGTSCSSTSTATAINIIAAPVATVTASGPTGICQGESVNLVANDGPDLTYEWQVGGATIPGATGSSYTASSAGSYQVVITNASACSTTSDAIDVTVNPQPTATITPNGPTTFCIGGTVLLQANSGNGFTYQWQNAGNVISGAVNNVLNVSQSGNYTVVVTNQFGCSALSSAIQVNVAGTQATITYTGSPAVCDGNSLVLNANTGAGLTYQWQNNGSNISGETSQSFTASVAGNYTVVVTDPNNCGSTSQPVVVTVGTSPATPVVSPAGPVSFCEGESIDLTYTTQTGITYAWSNAGKPLVGGGNGSLTVEGAGTYILTATNSSNCTASAAGVLVSVNSLPVVALTLDPDTVCAKGETLVLTGGTPAGGEFSGQFVENGVFTSPDQAGTFEVTYMFTDNNGCSATATDIVKVFDCTGIEGINSDYVGIYPNPSRSFVQLEASFRLDVSTVRIMDATGRIVNAPIEKTGEKTCIIHLENLAAGLYQVSVHKGTEVYTVKLVKSL